MLGQKDHRARHKEFGYVLPVSAAERELVARYQNLLTQSVARFAEVYYNYLFDNPSTAHVLYRYESEGGDVSELVRGLLQQLVSLVGGVSDEESVAPLMEIGRQHAEWGVEAVWIQGAFHLYLDHLQDLVKESDEIASESRTALQSVLVRLVYRAAGIAIQGYWEAILSMESARREGEQSGADEVVESLGAIFWSFDPVRNRFLYMSPAASHLFGDEQTSPVPGLHLGNDRDRTENPVWSAWERCLAGSPVEVECELPVNGTEHCLVRIRLQPALDGEGRVIRVDAVLEDVTSQRGRQPPESSAISDPLTGLVSRTLWDDRLQRAIAACKRRRDQQAVAMVLVLPADARNPRTAMATEEENILVEIADRLRNTLRESDTVARLGEREFGILLPSVDDGASAAARVSAKVLGLLADGIGANDAVIGAAAYPGHGDSETVLLERAREAGKRAWQQGMAYGFAEPDTEGGAWGRLGAQLRRAMAADQLELHYQPQVDIATYRIRGAEALLRWRHPDNGLMMPASFLDKVERGGLMPDLTDWILETSMRHRAAWSADGPGVPVAVNIADTHFRDGRLPAQVERVLNDHGWDGAMLTLEIGENALLADPPGSRRTLRALADLGVTVTLDNFGTGYFSLPAIKKMPIHAVKIDRSLMNGIGSDPDAGTIVRSMIDLGHNLGIDVVAEGVEDAVVWGHLERWGCDQGQGFYVTRPLPEARFAQRVGLEAWHPG